jgi:exopolysaccharide biosynthesis polyprenyl glycosylphosphotransferase
LPVPVVGRPVWERRYAALLVGIDGAAAIAAAITAYIIRFSPVAPLDATGSGGSEVARPLPYHVGYLFFSLLLPVVWVAALGLARAYDDKAFGLGSDEFSRVCRAAVGVTAAIAFLSYATKAEVARGYVILAIPIATLLCLGGRYAARKRLHRRRNSGACMSNVVAVGSESSVTELVSELRRDPHSGLRVVGVCLPAATNHGETHLGLPVLGGFDDVIDAVHLTSADTVAVTSSPEMNPTRLRRLSWQLERTDTDLVVAPGLMEVAGPRLHIRPVTGLPLLNVEEPEFAGARRLVKGAVDRLGALAAIVVLSPALLVIGILVRLTTPGPAFFRQTRIGRDGREFSMIKFRTMVRDAEARKVDLASLNERSDGLLFKIRADPRITRIGRILRKYSLDELPQFFNVLVGSMSLVGPRPPLPAEVARYGDDARRRLLVRPGLTGLWQISGRSDLPWEEAVRLDLRYVENWSLMYDVMILWKTFSAVIRGSGAY